MPGLGRQDGKGYGFLGIHVDPVVGRGGQRHSRQEGRQVRQDPRIVRPASGNDQFVGREGGDGRRYSQRNRRGGEHGGGGDQIGKRQAGLLSARHEFRAGLLG